MGIKTPSMVGLLDAPVDGEEYESVLGRGRLNIVVKKEMDAVGDQRSRWGDQLLLFEKSDNCEGSLKY